ncbi:MAG: hypothetical protein CVU24_13250 [Betaproteobacteria bacterium HGW-Betaproteobacteria-18]|nr:MAG: hypothetical protein CVU24_13250 [Betaproteobacteria bacterium HGW-Betaproteobacteria-18]
MAIATINRIIILFDEAFRSLSVDVPMVEVEQLAILVQSAMSGKKRAFHTTKHVLHLSRGMKPVQVLAALFHDVVYCQLDGGLSAQTATLLDGVTRSENGALLLREIKPEDKAVALCADIFGFAPGQILPLQRGMNEFLSAALAARVLQRHLTDAQLIAMVACIELTIPFRAQDENGQSAPQALAQRIQARCRKPGTGLFLPDQQTANFVKTVVTDAVIFANRDLSGFTAANPGRCLSNTLLLIEESMPHFAALSFCAIQEYRGALLRMDTFLRNLNPGHVCQSYGDHPDAPTLLDMGAAVIKNIAFSRDYLAALLTSTAIIEALALSTGTDCPIGMFLGDSTHSDGESDQIEDLLPAPPTGQPVNAELVNLFESEHILESINDLTASPLTEFVYRFLGHRGTQQALAQAQLMFDGHLPVRAFLQALNRDMVRVIILACAEIAVSRKQALLSLEQSLYASGQPV